MSVCDCLPLYVCVQSAGLVTRPECIHIQSAGIYSSPLWSLLHKTVLIIDRWMLNLRLYWVYLRLGVQSRLSLIKVGSSSHHFSFPMIEAFLGKDTFILIPIRV